MAQLLDLKNFNTNMLFEMLREITLEIELRTRHLESKANKNLFSPKSPPISKRDEAIDFHSVSQDKSPNNAYCIEIKTDISDQRSWRNSISLSEFPRTGVYVQLPAFAEKYYKSAGSIFVNDGKILLGIERDRTNVYNWSLPGGKREDFDTSAKETAARETSEEFLLDKDMILSYLQNATTLWYREGKMVFYIIRNVNIDETIHFNNIKNMSANDKAKFHAEMESISWINIDDLKNHKIAITNKDVLASLPPDAPSSLVKRSLLDALVKIGLIGILKSLMCK